MSAHSEDASGNEERADAPREHRPLIDVLQEVREQCFTDNQTSLYLRLQGTLMPLDQVTATPASFFEQAEDGIWQWLWGPYHDLDAPATDAPRYHTEGMVVSPLVGCEVMSETVPQGQDALAYRFPKRARLAVDNTQRMVTVDI